MVKRAARAGRAQGPDSRHPSAIWYTLPAQPVAIIACALLTEQHLVQALQWATRPSLPILLPRPDDFPLQDKENEEVTIDEALHYSTHSLICSHHSHGRVNPLFPFRWSRNT